MSESADNQEATPKRIGAKIPRDFGFGEDHEILRESARRFFEERCPIAEVRRLADDETGYDPDLWKQIAELGWLGLVIPEEYGGAGLGSLHLALLMEEMGRCLLPSPYLPQLLASFAVLEAASPEQRAKWLPALASGEKLATLALSEPSGSWEPEPVSASAEPSDTGYVLWGQKTHVLAANEADWVVAPFHDPDGRITLFRVEKGSAGLRIHPEVGIDPTRRMCRVSFDSVRVSAEAELGAADVAALRRIHIRSNAALAAEMVGGAETTLQMTREYAIARKQFGRQIGSFQAVKHPIVDMMVGIETSRTHSYAAAAALDHDPDAAEVSARMAKAAASDCFADAVSKAVQLHGGYGFTIDCDVHFYFKRAMWSRATLGDGTHHRRHLAERLFDAT